ncbi:MAG: Gx transporter family protein [Mariprofundaceae bacterium]|nr:Gx transporter family protein [Mariprofundaceae bacterium]
MTASQEITQIPRPSLASLEKKAYWLGLLLLASGLHVFEALMPSFGPWFKLGLANIITLIALQSMGAKAAASLAIGRVVIGAFFIGTMFTPTFIISLTATLASTSVMLISWRFIPRISLIGVSLLGALAHMCSQFVVVEQLFIQQIALYYLLPPLLVLSCATGWLNGALATYITAQLTIRSR